MVVLVVELFLEEEELGEVVEEKHCRVGRQVLVVVVCAR
jgi:hypothetical protein